MTLRLVASSLLALAIGCGGAAVSEPSKPPAPAASASASAIVAPTQAAPADIAASETPPPPPAPPAPDTPLPAAGPPVVTLIDPGAEPRKALRYTFRKAAETAIMDMQMVMAIRAGGADAREVAMPTMRTRLEVTPTNVDASGTLTAAFEVKTIDVLDDQPLAPAMRAKLTGELRKMVGLKGRSVVTARGMTLDATVDVPPGLPPSVQQLIDSMKDSLRNLACPFPVEAVGKNARWDVTTVVAGPVTIAQKATYTLRDVTGRRVALDVTLVQEAPRQVMKAGSSLPPGATMRLERYTGGGNGTTTIALDKMTPTSASKLTSNSEVQVDAGDQHQRMGIDLAMDIRVKLAR